MLREVKGLYKYMRLMSLMPDVILYMGSSAGYTKGKSQKKKTFGKVDSDFIQMCEDYPKFFGNPKGAAMLVEFI